MTQARLFHKISDIKEITNCIIFKLQHVSIVEYDDNMRYDNPLSTIGLAVYHFKKVMCI